ncbi:MAG: hypothetical protein IPF68_16835 [Bacteroidales bacterium]|nr:hypothetical protein [Bacteroidales bacterium]
MFRTIQRNIMLLLAGLAITLASAGNANNISVTNVSLTGQNVADNYTFVRFDISWENSWRTGSAPTNWDAAWIFVKYRVASGNWSHATLRAADHLAPEGSTISAPEDNSGVFLYRSADGSGTFSKTGVKLRWDYGIDGVVNTDIVDVKVFATEMVYVPQGSFFLGSGGTETSHLYSYPTSSSSYLVNNEGEITVLQQGNLYYNISSNSGDGLGPVPAAFLRDIMRCM